MLDGFASWCANRDALASDLEWVYSDGVYVADTPYGRMSRTKVGGSWILSFFWRDGFGTRVVTRGSRRQIERRAHEIAYYGPPGGPDFIGQELRWVQFDDDPTLRAVALGGAFLLMPTLAGLYVLLFARNNGDVCVLGLGDREELERSADERLEHDCGEPLSVRIGGQRNRLRALGAASVVGRLDLVGDMQIILAHLSGDRFGLYCVRGLERTLLGQYSAAELHEGDLGPVLTWAQPSPESPRVSAAAIPSTDRSVAPNGARTEAAPPRPHLGQARPPSTPRNGLESGGRPPAFLVQLDERVLRAVLGELSPEQPLRGQGSSIVSRIFEGLRVMVRRGVREHRLMYASHLRKLIHTGTGVHIHCCDKTFSRALAVVAAETRILVRTGRRWQICLGELYRVDSDLLLHFMELASSLDGEDEAATDAPRTPMEKMTAIPASAIVTPRVGAPGATCEDAAAASENTEGSAQVAQNRTSLAEAVRQHLERHGRSGSPEQEAGIQEGDVRPGTSRPPIHSPMIPTSFFYIGPTTAQEDARLRKLDIAQVGGCVPVDVELSPGCPVRSLWTSSYWPMRPDESASRFSGRKKGRDPP